jgi:hypothetical protein
MTPETIAWIEQQKPQLVDWAENYVKESELFKLQNLSKKTLEELGKNPQEEVSVPPPKVSPSQLRNLLGAAQAGHSIAILINFLRYQMGREGWKDEKSGKMLEKYLTKELKETLLKDSRENQDAHAIEAHIAAQFLGFIIREYTYRHKLAVDDFKETHNA